MKLEIKKIQKRDGRMVKFDPNKTTQAMFKAFMVSNEIGDEKKSLKEAERLTPIAVDLFKNTINGETPSVETMQDVVEKVLMAASHYQTAKVYILYREKQKKTRDAKSILGVEDDLDLHINQLKVMQSRYLRQDKNGKIIETPRQLFERVAKAVATNEKKDKTKWQKQFFEIMANFEFMPAGGYLRTAGTQECMLANCFVLPVKDSMEGIFDSVKWMALVHQKGGGTGFNFSALRPKGDMVNSSGGYSSGPVSFMKVFDAATRQVMQGGFRRGANMGILDINHPDIFDFITCKTEEDEITNFNISVGIKDEFMKAVEKDGNFDLKNPRDNSIVQTIPARTLFDQIITLAWRTGDPGVIFLDAINRNNPVIDTLGPMVSTNPCIVGNSLVSTNQGLVPMEKLKINIGIICDQRVVSDKSKIIKSSISAFYDQGEKEVWQLITKAGFKLVATADHKIRTTDGWIKLEKLSKQNQLLLQSQAGEFGHDDKIPHNFEHKSLPTKWSLELGQVLGWLVGDGWIRDGDKNCRVGFVFSQKDKHILNYFQPLLNSWYGNEIKSILRTNQVFHLSYHGQYFIDFFKTLGVKSVKAQKKQVPNSLFTAPKEAVIGFLQGIFSADGTVGIDTQKGNYYVRLSSKSKKLLEQIQLILLNLGIKSNLYDRSWQERRGFVYQDKLGQKKDYKLDGILWELNISKQNLQVFLNTIGFITNKHQSKIQKLAKIRFKKENFIDSVLSVKPFGKAQVYDLTEPKTHSFIANGIVISNCGEQPLHPFDVCNLGSINLAAFIKADKKINWQRLEEVVRLAVRFLDNGVDISQYPIEQIEQMAKANRRIGLGIMGWADLLCQLGIAYNCPQAFELAQRVMRFIYSISHNESEMLAKEKGNFPNWKDSEYEKKGVKQRNLALITIAPTGTISMVSNCSSGIEPIYALSYVKNVVDANGLTYINPYFEQALSHHVLDEDLRQDILEEVAQTGSCQNVNGVPQKLKDIFVTAHDVAWDDHIRMQAAFQKWTDNAVSKTINFPNSATIEEVAQAYMLAWKLGCKGMTIYRDGSKDFQILQSNNNNKKTKKKVVIQSKIKIKPLNQRIKESEKELRIMNYESSIKIKNQNQKNKKIHNTKYIIQNTEKCPECGEVLQMSEGCSMCLSCGFSKCSL
jgi:ribonucleoside-diphosphate reductase alpha chain